MRDIIMCMLKQYLIYSTTVSRKQSYVTNIAIVKVLPFPLKTA